VRRAWWFVLTLLVVAAGIVLLAVFPARTYLAQRDNIDAAEQRLEILAEQNKQLGQRAARLHTDDEIERLAREQYSLVKPGEEAYAILPAPEPEKPAARPRPAPPKEKSFWGKVGDSITFWN
jgi:cell division protein FtsB